MERDKRILVIDDPFSLLMLAKASKQKHLNWKLVSVASEQEALNVLDQQNVDAIVAKAPENGSQASDLYEQISSRHLGMICFFVYEENLSSDASLWTSGLNHLLTHYCDAASLEETLQHVLMIQDLLSSEQLRISMAKIQSVPSLPAIYQEVSNRLRTENATVREIGEIIQSDPAMSAKILQLVNSAFFGLNRKLTNVAEAASIIGLEKLNALVLTIGIFSQFDQINDPEFSMLSYVQHSLDTADIAKRLAQDEGLDDQHTEAAYLAGLLHDIGMLVLMQNCPEEFQAVKTALMDGETHLGEIETNHFGESHAAIGGYLLGLWGLPKSIIEAVAFHHHPSQAKHPGFSPLTAVHIASTLSSGRSLQGGHPSPFGEMQIDLDHLVEIGMSGKLDLWGELANDLA